MGRDLRGTMPIFDFLRSSCVFLRFPAKIGGFLRRSRLLMLCFLGTCKNQQRSTKSCVCPLTQKAQRSQKFILARTHDKKIPPRTKKTHSRLNIPFLVWSFHSRLRISIPGLGLLWPERGSDWKNLSRLNFSFRIESLSFSILPLKIELVQSWCPLG